MNITSDSPAGPIRAGVLLFALLGGLLLGCGSTEGSNDRTTAEERSTAEAPDLASRVDSLARDLLDRSTAPGVSIGVLHAGEVLLARDYTRGGDVGAGELTYNVASLSKPVTAWAIMALVEAGRIDLDAPVNRYLTSWTLPAGSASADSVTIRRVLAHTAGLSMPSAPWFAEDSVAGFPPGPRPESIPGLQTVLHGISPEEGVRIDGPLDVWRYSGGGYVLLEQLIEDVAGDDFARVVGRNVFAPLGMSSSSFSDSVSPIAGPHAEDGSAMPPYRVVGSAAGGLHSSVADMLRLLGACAESGRPVLGESVFRTMITPVALVGMEGAEGAEYALGHGVHVSPDGSAIVYHSGSNPGYVAYMIVDTRRGEGLVVLTNGDGAIPLVVGIVEGWAEATGVSLPPLY